MIYRLMLLVKRSFECCIPSERHVFEQAGIKFGGRKKPPTSAGDVSNTGFEIANSPLRLRVPVLLAGNLHIRDRPNPVAASPHLRAKMLQPKLRHQLVSAKSQTTNP